MSSVDPRLGDAVTARVADFYEAHPYPNAVDDLAAYRNAWDDGRRLAEAHLFWPAAPYRDERNILIAGCGTIQAAHYAVRWPRAQVTGIDVSATSVARTQALARQHGLENLQVRQLPVERVAELGQTFDYIVCTGVLHHLAEPVAGLRALRDVLDTEGALNLMVYAPYGRAGIYLLQDYCRRLGIGWSAQEIENLANTLGALPKDHPLAALLRSSPDFASNEGIADALLHPQDRSYSVPQLFELLGSADVVFGRWIRQAPYLANCGSVASTPHRARLEALEASEQYAALELFRGTMMRHSLVVFRKDRVRADAVDFSGDRWPQYVPIRLPGTIAVRERLPAGASAVLINRNHAYTDLYLPIEPWQDALLGAIDGERSIAQMGRGRARASVRAFFEQLWRWDQAVFDTSHAGMDRKDQRHE